jgi:hypothetical protein
MAETYNLICDQCRVRLWIGQDHAGNRDKFYLYGGGWAVPRAQPEPAPGLDPGGPTRVFSPAAKFLLDHELHPLRFVSGNSMPYEAEDYVELDGDDPQLGPADRRDPID